jgi:hypothetical protein
VASPIAAPAAPAAAAAAPPAAERASAPARPRPERERVAPKPEKPPASKVTAAISSATRSPWLPVGVVAAALLYLLGQRLLDRGRKLAYAGRPGEPDDELIEL